MSKSQNKNGGRKSSGSYNSNQNRSQSSDNSNKDEKFCKYCRKSGHEKADCFKLVGYPDWYKGKKNNNHNQHAYMSKEESSPLVEADSDSEKEESMQVLVQREVQKALRNKSVADSSKNHEFSAFAGPSI
ncbi:uncharacterized protein [Euphorbia lathyris]|uniref:uncharacterized protein n=1 Tax=Euphorbia lathyris TaxID=212925 RepID=UPI0033132DCC